MRFLEAFATAFVNTFGITPPSRSHQRRAAWFIVGMLTVMLLLVLAMAIAFRSVLHR